MVLHAGVLWWRYCRRPVSYGGASVTGMCLMVALVSQACVLWFCSLLVLQACVLWWRRCCRPVSYDGASVASL